MEDLQHGDGWFVSPPWVILEPGFGNPSPAPFGHRQPQLPQHDGVHGIGFRNSVPQACEHDLEGIVAKHKKGRYLPDGEATWFKIRNRSYSQWVGREELFERERERNPEQSCD